jgi:hypothetical protein
MDLKINKDNLEKRRRTPHYVLTINFMEGDADDYHEEKVIIEPNEIDKYKNLIFATEICNSAYQHGRGGYDNYYGLLEYDAFFAYDGIDASNYNREDFDLDENVSDDEFQVFLENKVKEINPLRININHPSDSNSGIFDSFDGYSLYYIDENGDSFNVDITFSEEEKEKINHTMISFR